MPGKLPWDKNRVEYEMELAVGPSKSQHISFALEPTCPQLSCFSNFKCVLRNMEVA